MSNKVLITNSQKAVKVPSGLRILIRRACNAVLEYEHFTAPAEISVTFVDNAAIAELNKKASREKAKAVVAELRAMKLKEAAEKVEDSIEETLSYCDFPGEHWTRIRTNNVIERLNREIRRRTRVVGMFPDGNSALMLVYARLTQWGSKKYMNMKHLEAALDDASIAGRLHSAGVCKPFCA